MDISPSLSLALSLSFVQSNNQVLNNNAFIDTACDCVHRCTCAVAFNRFVRYTLNHLWFRTGVLDSPSSSCVDFCFARTHSQVHVRLYVQCFYLTSLQFWWKGCCFCFFCIRWNYFHIWMSSSIFMLLSWNRKWYVRYKLLVVQVSLIQKPLILCTNRNGKIVKRPLHSVDDTNAIIQSIRRQLPNFTWVGENRPFRIRFELVLRRFECTKCDGLNIANKSANIRVEKWEKRKKVLKFTRNCSIHQNKKKHPSKKRHHTHYMWFPHPSVNRIELCVHLAWSPSQWRIVMKDEFSWRVWCACDYWLKANAF